MTARTGSMTFAPIRFGPNGLTLMSESGSPPMPESTPSEGGERRVRVLDVDGADMGLGTYEGDELVDIWLDGTRMTSPRIKLDSGDVIYGYDCWWADA